VELPNLYDKIRRSLAHILVLKDGEVVSKGSGFCFRPTGEILTAAHTAIGGFPVTEKDYAETKRIIVARLVHQEKALQYRIAICPFEIEHTGTAMSPLQLDIAILTPANSQHASFEYLPPSLEPPQLGDELFFAGYSDEVEFPFGVDRLLSSNAVGIDDFRSEFDFDIKRVIAGPMIKRGTVGNAIRMTSKSQHSETRVTSFYLDNQIHYGASGGPIVNRDGAAKGIILKRALTSTNDSEGTSIAIPSGSTLGVALDIFNVPGFDQMLAMAIALKR
jgi:hypothetical protein